MENVVCPYCDVEITLSQIESEGGCCPECGAIITASVLSGDEDDDEGGEFGNEEGGDDLDSEDDEY